MDKSSTVVVEDACFVGNPVYKIQFDSINMRFNWRMYNFIWINIKIKNSCKMKSDLAFIPVSKIQKFIKDYLHQSLSMSRDTQCLLFILVSRFTPVKSSSRKNIPKRKKLLFIILKEFFPPGSGIFISVQTFYASQLS